MRVFKFGGASVKDASAVRNVGEIIRREGGKDILVVVSAMGKSTNELESILDAAYRRSYQKRLQELKMFHINIVSELFPPASNPLYQMLDEVFDALNQQLKTLDTQLPYGQNYDAVVSFGERISSTILAHYLNEVGIETDLLFAPDYIKTDARWQEGIVDWKATQQATSPLLKNSEKKVWLTQGFLGGSPQGEVVTLGREGSDYSAAIFAHSLPAQSVTIWKDVPGVLNADPKRVSETELFPKLSYQEAAEMTYYGASVIHPKTIKPLANQQIPLFVRSFVDADAKGTEIGDFKEMPQQTAIIFKGNQAMIRFEAKDLSNINQRTLSRLIETLSDLHIKINLMMNTAVSFSICIDTHPTKIEEAITKLNNDFEVSVKYNLELVTLKNYTKAILDKFYQADQALLTLRTSKNFQFVKEA